jgi:hypothetical protein
MTQLMKISPEKLEFVNTYFWAFLGNTLCNILCNIEETMEALGKPSSKNASAWTEKRERTAYHPIQTDKICFERICLALILTIIGHLELSSKPFPKCPIYDYGWSFPWVILSTLEKSLEFST